MKILMTTSEAHPFVKTGGLADMVSALSLALTKLGHDVRIVLPRYYAIDRTKLDLIDGPLGVPLGGGEEWCAVYTTSLPGSTAKKPVPVYFLDHEKFFGRDGVYGNAGESDFHDNPRRFSFLSRAAFQLCRKLNWYPDVLHAHDWPTALVPVYLKFGERQGPFARTVSALTIHNLGYQGVYDQGSFYHTGLGWNAFYEGGFEDWGMMNLLKAGLWSADTLNTVSQRYCEETKTGEYGCHLDGVLRYRSADYRGILNGVDTDTWNPRKDKLIPATYSEKDLSGKRLAKEALQKEFGLAVAPDVPVLGFVSRLTGQKGVGDLFGPAYGSAYSFCRDLNMQFAILGSGEAWCENELRGLAERLPNLKVKIGYSEKISHLIEAGSDFFIMPSRYEPSGLNQMYSLNYGTLPIVRNTGGLADTVENFNPETGSGTGFMFDYLSPKSIYDTVHWAVWTYENRRDAIEKMRVRGMKEDFSWAKSAKKYVEMYEWTVKKTFN